MRGLRWWFVVSLALLGVACGDGVDLESVTAEEGASPEAVPGVEEGGGPDRAEVPSGPLEADGSLRLEAVEREARAAADRLQNAIDDTRDEQFPQATLEPCDVGSVDVMPVLEHVVVLADEEVGSLMPRAEAALEEELPARAVERRDRGDGSQDVSLFASREDPRQGGMATLLEQGIDHVIVTLRVFGPCVAPGTSEAADEGADEGVSLASTASAVESGTLALIEPFARLGDVNGSVQECGVGFERAVMTSLATTHEPMSRAEILDEVEEIVADLDAVLTRVDDRRLEVRLEGYEYLVYASDARFTVWATGPCLPAG